MTAVNPYSVEDKLKACKSARVLAAQSLHTILGTLLSYKQSISEVQLCDTWLAEMRKNPTIFPDGWYMPPPHGIGVLFGSAHKESRMNYLHLRLPQVWPRSDITLGGKNEMAYLYASPVDKSTGIIGDFGMVIYLGNENMVIKHLKLCLKINHELLDSIKIGMTFKDFYRNAEKKFESYNLSNNILSTSDPTSVNIGHTIPATFENWTEEEQRALESAEITWDTKCKIISMKRKFVNAVEEQQFKKGMAVTLEPRLVDRNNPNIPMSSYHTIILFHEDGTKELVTNFDEIFKTLGTNYML